MEKQTLDITLNEAFNLLSTNLENHCNCIDYAPIHKTIYEEIKEKFFHNNDNKMKLAWIKYQTTKYEL